MLDFYLGLFMAAIITGGAIYMVYSFFRLYIQGKASADWLPVEGVIIESRSEPYMNGDIPDIRYIIKYKYFLNGIDYINDRLFFKTYDLDDTDYSKKYKVGKKPKVYYNPLKPEDSVLEKGLRPEIQLLLFFALILLGMAYFVSPFSLGL